MIFETLFAVLVVVACACFAAYVTVKIRDAEQADASDRTTYTEHLFLALWHVGEAAEKNTHGFSFRDVQLAVADAIDHCEGMDNPYPWTRQPLSQILDERFPTQQNQLENYDWTMADGTSWRETKQKEKEEHGY